MMAAVDGEGFVRVTDSQMEWKIKKFMSARTWRNYDNDYIKSKRCRLCNITWEMKVCPKSYSKPNSMSVYLKRSFPTAKVHSINVAIGIRKANGSVLYSIDRNMEFPSFSKGHFRVGYLDRDLLNSKDWLPNGNLTIVCNMKHVDAAFSEESLPKKKHSTLVQNLESLFLNEHGTDVVFKVQKKNFKAHRSILLARSTVFAAMFQHDTAEKRSGVVEITDCDPDRFKEFLVFLYTGRSDLVQADNVIDLYAIADKYAVKDLKVMSVNFMSLNLSTDSACDVILLATLYNEMELLQTSTNFFIKNMKQIVLSEKWLDFQTTHVDLVTELFVKTADYMKRLISNTSSSMGTASTSTKT